ncbi:odorant receptor 2a-like [Cylas formicarius]|uniref:odorant receptor 2a-like n=1 Tax=Cylas formicarius TaxID=197179 RepID=UPI002958481E|nr:odorant receptor 2a-like [Cylas formicarius]XP_060534053.1 odorant receptor 2a-like [Cylas formicarius]
MLEGTGNMAADSGRHPSILTLARYSMTSVGFWKYHSQKNPLKLFYSTYSGFIVLYFMTYTISVGIKFVITVSAASTVDSEIIKQLSFIISSLIPMYVVMVCRSSGFNEIISLVRREEQSIITSDDADILKSHLKQIRRSNAVNGIFSAFACCTGFAMALENYRPNVKVARYNREHNTTLERPLLVDLYYFKLNTQKHADLLLVVSEICFIFNTLIILSSKLCVYTCVIFTSSLLKKLQIRFSKTGLRQEHKLAALKSLVMEHQNVIEFVDKLNVSIRYLVLLEYLLNSLNVAAASVQLITYDKKMLLMLFFYVSFLLMQVFIMGISANEIKVQSITLSDALYSSPWHEQSEATKKVLLIMIARTQRPLMLTIGPFGPMAIESALAVCKASYSYVTLMMQNVH